MLGDDRPLIRRIALGGAAACVVALALGADTHVEGRAATVTPPTLTGPIKSTAPLGDA